MVPSQEVSDAENLSYKRLKMSDNESDSESYEAIDFEEAAQNQSQTANNTLGQHMPQEDLSVRQVRLETPQQPYLTKK
jgi:hypothetical protein